MPRIKKINDEVCVAEDSIVRVDAEQIAMLTDQVGRNPRQRVRLCAHKDAQDRLHEMMIVLTSRVYIRPHKHTHKSESFHVIKGEATVVFFEDDGRIAEVIDIGDFASGKPFYFRNDDPRYHTQIITSKRLVFHEITNGPFDRADTQFAPWAPEEGDAAAAAQYIAALKERIAARK
jgi:cupin fold WbuC family metalloprotein